MNSSTLFVLQNLFSTNSFKEMKIIFQVLSKGSFTCGEEETGAAASAFLSECFSCHLPYTTMDRLSTLMINTHFNWYRPFQ